LVAGVSFGQKKVLNDIKKELKDKAPNIEELRSTMKQVLNDPETASSAEAWYVAGEIENKQYDLEYIKEEIGTPPNEKKMSEGLFNIYPYFEKSYELDNLPDEKGKIKPKHTKNIVSMMKANRVGYINAGSYFFNNQQWDKAYDSFMMFLEMDKLPMMKGEKFVPLAQDYGDSTVYQIEYYAGLAAVNGEEHEKAIKMFSGLRGKNYEEENVYQLLTEEYKTIGDDANYMKALEEGYQKFPTNSYFLLTLIDMSLQNEDTDRAINYLTLAINQKGDDPFFYDILGQVYRQTGDNDQALVNMKKAIEIDPTYSEAYTQLGNTYYVIADELRLQADDMSKTDQRKANELYDKCEAAYREAIPNYKKAIELNPSDMVAVSNLRSVYYILNDPAMEELNRMYPTE
jgi:Putative Zn-dependent protease, contains TPR repeats